MLTRRLEDNIKTDLTDTGCEGVEWCWAGSQKVPTVGFCEYCNEPKCSLQVTTEDMFLKINRFLTGNCFNILRLFKDAFHLLLLRNIGRVKTIVRKWVNN